MSRAPCSSCIWWLLQPEITTKSGERLGQCRDESPKLYIRAIDGQPLTRWPLTIESDFCRAHEGGEVAE
jgi:hypothetical protein